MPGQAAMRAAKVGGVGGEIVGGFTGGFVHGVGHGWQVGAHQYKTGPVGSVLTGAIKGYGHAIQAGASAKQIEAAPEDRAGETSRQSRVLTAGEPGSTQLAPASKGTAPMAASGPRKPVEPITFSDEPEAQEVRVSHEAPASLGFSHPETPHPSPMQQTSAPAMPVFQAPNPLGAPPDRAAAPARRSVPVRPALFSDAASTTPLSHSAPTARPTPMPLSAATNSSAGVASAWRTPPGEVMPLSSSTLGSVFKPTFSG